ncbi:SET domain protein [Ceratobasidium sp. AG-Ba]|nr:SET domain protein [Ceratobasidium sp. AG-Ba]
MNVKISNLPMKDKSGKPLENEGTPILRSALVSTKDIKEGDVIYKENAVVTALDLDLQALRTHCTHCMQEIDIPITVPDDPLEAVYCSTTCHMSSKAQSQNALFGLEPPLPLAPEDDDQKPKTDEELEARKKAQEDFIQLLRNTGATRPLLVARFVACMVAEQSAKLGAATPTSLSSKPPSPAEIFGLPEPEGDDSAYSFHDHIERLRFLEIVENPAEIAEMEALKKVLQTAMEGLEGFVGDRYALLKGKMAYNAIGVCINGGRDDKPLVTVRPEDVERTRTPYGTSRQSGSAFYRVSSYLSHSCAPNTRPEFTAGTAELYLIANRDIPAGTELTMAYVDVNQGPSETRLEARRRRRQELARGWRFACECERCLKELEEGILKEDEKKDEDENLNVGEGAKLEEAVMRYGTEEQRPGPAEAE